MGKPSPDDKDRRVQRTRRALREALISLVLEKGWEAFSVQDVCDRADVGRSTFYTHYADKEDLLIGSLGDLRKGIRKQFAPASPHASRPLAFARGVIDHAKDQQRLFRAIVGKLGGHVVQTRFREMILELVREDLAAAAPASSERDAAAHFITGAFLELITWWLNAKPSMHPDDLEALLHRWTEPVVEPLRRSRR